MTQNKLDTSRATEAVKDSRFIEALSLFPKYINVFDCIHIYAEASISDQKVLHAAAIAAENASYRSPISKTISNCSDSKLAISPHMNSTGLFIPNASRTKIPFSMFFCLGSMPTMRLKGRSLN